MLTRTVLFVLVLVGVARFASATQLYYGTAGSCFSDQWNVDLPAGSVVHSCVVASTDYVANAPWNWTVVFTAQGPSVTVVRPYPYNPATVTWTDPAVSAEFSFTIVYSEDMSENPQTRYATVQAGIAGPPAGLVHLAQANRNDVSGSTTDEKWSTLVGGNYTIWHGGGTSGSNFAYAFTDVTW